ncbi:hypothetical protein BW737_007820 [Actinomyces ruminis]|uniref:Transposase DDE domain-containing protein n=1 Tax=Actinomyces ruminis TaxID=1937003 RepID=A0ABX4MB98_9ACTO|nr:hypothetical protein BW737_007820 [Actinomyces ruminis]
MPTAAGPATGTPSPATTNKVTGASPATIPVKADQADYRKARGRLGGRPPTFDPIAYKDCNAVERGFGRLK